MIQIFFNKITIISKVVGLIPLTPFSQERRGNDLECSDLAPPSWGRACPALAGGWGEAVFSSNYGIAIFYFIQLFPLMFLLSLTGGRLCG
jgi:hypothetical protein